MSYMTPIRASNDLVTEVDLPKTAVFVGGTDGIGKATLKNLVCRGSPTKVYIVGRDETKHEALLAELRMLNPKATLIYVQGQISLVAESKRIADKIAAAEDKIDLLYLSAGYLPFNGRQETSEGLETSQVVSYYSRIVFVLRLLSKLRAAASISSSPRVINILGAGKESTGIFLDDLTLKSPGHFNMSNYRVHAGTMTTLTLKHIAELPENKDIVFVHAHPGLVATNLVAKSRGIENDNSSPANASTPSGNFVSSTPDEAGERCVYLITSAEYGGKGIAVQNGRQAAQTLAHGTGGSLFSINDKLEINQQDSLLTELEMMEAPQRIWTHTSDVLSPFLESS